MLLDQLSYTATTIFALASCAPKVAVLVTRTTMNLPMGRVCTDTALPVGAVPLILDSTAGSDVLRKRRAVLATAVSDAYTWMAEKLPPAAAEAKVTCPAEYSSHREPRSNTTSSVAPSTIPAGLPLTHPPLGYLPAPQWHQTQKL